MNFVPPYNYGNIPFTANQPDTNEQVNVNQNYGYRSCGCPSSCPTYQNCCQVVEKCDVEDVPHYINYHTHVVNNCIKRHYNVPTYTTDEETVIINEYVNGVPNQQYPYMNQMPNDAQGFGNNFNPMQNFGLNPFGN